MEPFSFPPCSPFFYPELTGKLIGDDLPSLIAYSRTCKNARKVANDLIFKQFTILLDYCSKIFENSERTPENFIYSRLKLVKNSMDSKDEFGCREFKLFKQALDLLNMFFNIIPVENQEALFQQNCPFLINEKVLGSEESRVQGMSKLSTQECFDRFNNGGKDVLDEIKKIGWFTKECLDKDLYKNLPSNYALGSVYCSGKIYTSIIENNEVKNKECIFDSADPKWKVVKSIFNDLLGMIESNSILISPNDFKVEIKDEKKELIDVQKKILYTQLYLYITKLIIFKPQAYPILTKNQTCIHISNKVFDSSGKPELRFFSVNNNNIIKSNSIDLYKYNSIEELENELFGLQIYDLQKQIIYNQIRRHITSLKNLYIESTDPILNINQYCIRPSARDIDIYGNPTLVLSYRRLDGMVNNIRFNNLPDMKSTQDFYNTLNCLLNQR